MIDGDLIGDELPREGRQPWQPSEGDTLPPRVEPDRNSRAKFTSAVRAELAAYEIRRGREFHSEPRGLTQLQVIDFTEGLLAKLEEGGS